MRGTPAHVVAVVASAVVVGDEPGVGFGLELADGGEGTAVEGRGPALLEHGALETLADRVVVGRAGRILTWRSSFAAGVPSTMEVTAKQVKASMAVNWYTLPTPLNFLMKKLSRQTSSPGPPLAMQDPKGSSFLSGSGTTGPVVAAAMAAARDSRSARRPSPWATICFCTVDLAMEKPWSPADRRTGDGRWSAGSRPGSRGPRSSAVGVASTI